MSQYEVTVAWQRGDAVFTDDRYSRAHTWSFDGGVEVPASSSPHVVPLPYSVAGAVDPEEAFVASLSSCHMLTFLHIAARRGYRVDSYRDAAVGVMSRDESGQLAITRVTLRPQVVVGGESRPDPQEILKMHHEAHEQCFIARSVKTVVDCEPSPGG